MIETAADEVKKVIRRKNRPKKIPKYRGRKETWKSAHKAAAEHLNLKSYTVKRC